MAVALEALYCTLISHYKWLGLVVRINTLSGDKVGWLF